MHKATGHIQQSKNFRNFQRLIRTRSQNLGLLEDPETYRDKLELEAEEIVEAWKDTKEDLDRHLRELFFEPGLALSGEVLKASLLHSGVTELAIAAGVAVGLLAMKGLNLRGAQTRANAYQFLTEVIKAENDALRLPSLWASILTDALASNSGRLQLAPIGMGRRCDAVFFVGLRK